MKNLRLLALCLLVSLMAQRVFAQAGNATVTGRITDATKAVIVGARVAAINTGTNVRYEGATNGTGSYVISGIPPGPYRIEVEKTGFKTVVEPSVVFHTQDTLEINFEMAIGSMSESVTVNANASSVESDNPAVSMTVTREFVEDMPLNGRSFQDLIQLAPGTVSSSNGATYGYYSINGQRIDSNNFTVDGVSANLGGINNSSEQSGGSLSGNAPLQTVLGTTQSLVSVDALQEFKIQTSGYTAEYGRSPGGQIGFTTRSGTNDIHGTLFEYLRNTIFDANSYTNDYFDIPQTAEHQNDYGGTVGGPLVIPKLYNGKDKTFFFISFERLHLLQPAFESEFVPTQAFRSWASPSIQPFLNAEPLPNPNSPGNLDGCTIPDPSTGLPTACDALFTYGYSNPSTLNNIGVRLDQNFGGRFHAFVRYADTPSSAVTGAEAVVSSTINIHTWTAGLTANISSTLLNELRFNYSHDEEAVTVGQKSIGGSVPLSRDLILPAAYENNPYASGFYFIYVPNTALNAQSIYQGGASRQHQYQIVDGLVWTRGAHSLKFGVDWRRLTPTTSTTPYLSYGETYTLPDIQQGNASYLDISAGIPGKPVFDNLSLYAEDHWNIGPRLSVDYGLRWEFDPPPGPSNGEYPITLTSNDLTTAQVGPIGTPPYQTRYNHFAPRVGFAWNAIPSARHAVTVRAGFGIFYDTGQGVVASAYTSAYPFLANGPVQNEVPLPLSSSALAPPSLNFPVVPPYPQLKGISSPNLTLPYSEAWNLSLDEALNARNTLTVSYVGNEGKKLLFTEYYPSVPGNPAFANGIYYTSNGSDSNYNALQIQDTGRIANGLDLVGSFTWAHALDNASSNFSQYAPIYGNSDYDLRRVLNLALNYRPPTVGSRRWERALTHGWIFSNRFTAQSGYPISNIYQTTGILSNGTQIYYYPDRVSGVPIYLKGSAADVNGQAVPGNWRLNPAAFSLVPTDPTSGIPIRQGTLGRNYVQNPGFWALNTALQRTFPIYERLNLVFRVDAFNVFNHPNLSGPDTNLADSTFGQLIFGGVTTIGSTNSLYAMGAPRSLQFSLKLQF